MNHIVFAAPREGKTYWVTHLVYDTIRQINKNPAKCRYKYVYTNYPVVTPWGSSMRWTSDLAVEVITDALIVIDEAYMDYNSRKVFEFTGSEHAMFATCGHNNNDFYLIAHSPARLDPVIRETTHIFYFVKKFAIPFTSRPIFFRIEGYLDEISLSKRFSPGDQAYWSCRHVWFRKKVAECYDTHFFRKIEAPYVPVPWSSFIPEMDDVPIEKNKLSKDQKLKLIKHFTLYCILSLTFLFFGGAL